MGFNTRLLNDWILVVGMNIVVFFVSVWKYRIGDAAPRVALVSGLSSLLILDALVLLIIRARNRRAGLPLAWSLVVGAIIGGMLSASALWLALANEMSVNDLMSTAHSSKPISEIRPEIKALAVQLLRRELESDKTSERIISQTKPLDPPLFSNKSFRSQAVMQQEVDALRKAVALDFTTYDQHEHDLNEFRSAIKKMNPAYLRTFNSTIRSKEESWEGVLSLDRQLLDATVDLYAFAARNPENISFQFGNLVSHDAGIWNTFAAKRMKCIDLLRELQRLVPRRLLA
jgi:hypothetical protein